MIKVKVEKDRKTKETWIRCGECGHKLLKVWTTGQFNSGLVEMKCHSCKMINSWNCKVDQDI